MDGAQILLVGLAIGCILRRNPTANADKANGCPHVVPGLVEHVGSPCLHLSLAFAGACHGKVGSIIKHVSTCDFCERAYLQILELH